MIRFTKLHTLYAVNAYLYIAYSGIKQHFDLKPWCLSLSWM